ncbi:hypothetical protein F5Y06DRAFT_270405 [Hypoxylon sp. FL0890]|nr:hypothetical protein F5Y06DRAFT_270405 [Hypoxylon sp. FL0890]
MIFQWKRWKGLTVDNHFFEDITWQPIDYIAAVDCERKICFQGCVGLVFQTTACKSIWITEGDGEMVVSA